MDRPEEAVNFPTCVERSHPAAFIKRSTPTVTVTQARPGRIYLKYFIKGRSRAIEVSSGTTDYEEALEMLRKKMASTPGQQGYADQQGRVRIGQLLDLLIKNYEYLDRKSLYDTKLRVEAHLRPFFGEMKAQTLGTTALMDYVARRRQNAAPATIYKELSWLRRAMRLGAKHTPPLVLQVPSFEMLSVDNAREGTISHESYRMVRDLLPPYARIALMIGYHTGARKGEIRLIRRDKIDLAARRIYLPGRTTKNGKPRYLPIYGDMAAELDMALSMGDPQCPFLVQDQGKQVFDFEKAWATACQAAGIPEALFHDLRRTALTNMIEAGLSEKEAMEISGHKTRAVFDRYHIVSERRLIENAEKLAQHLKTKEIAQDSLGLGQDTQVLVQDTGARQKTRPN